MQNEIESSAVVRLLENQAQVLNYRAQWGKTSTVQDSRAKAQSPRTWTNEVIDTVLSIG